VLGDGAQRYAFIDRIGQSRTIISAVLRRSASSRRLGSHRLDVRQMGEIERSKRDSRRNGAG
jgi:hypothetical protein